MTERITPLEIGAVAKMMIDALHCLDTEAQQIADRVARNGGTDGVQVLEDAEAIIKAAAGLLILEARDETVAQFQLTMAVEEGLL